MHQGASFDLCSNTMNMSHKTFVVSNVPHLSMADKSNKYFKFQENRTQSVKKAADYTICGMQYICISCNSINFYWLF